MTSLKERDYSDLIEPTADEMLDAAETALARRHVAETVEQLIERLCQATVDYENCDRSASKHMRCELEKAKQAIRDAVATACLPQEVRLATPEDVKEVLACLWPEEGELLLRQRSR